MTDLTGGLLGVQEKPLHGRTVSVVAHSALLESRCVMGVKLYKPGLLMAIEAAAFEMKSSALVEFMALGALHAGDRGMLTEGCEPGGRICSR